MRPRSDRVALTIAAAGTTWAATLSWRGFTDAPIRYELPVLFLAAVVAGSGIALRLAHLAAPLVLLLQTMISGVVASLMLCGAPLPLGSAWVRLNDNLAQASANAGHYQAPVPATDGGVFPLLIGGAWFCLLLVDGLACGLRRVPLAGLPLLMIYSVPVSMLGGVPWLTFALTAGGFLVMLFLHESERVTRWGRPLGNPAEDDPSGFGVSTGAIKATAGTVGGVATALAVFVPLLIPTANLGILGFGQGTGPGGNTLAVENPITDLRRDLRRGEDVPLIRIRTDDPDPSYLRIASLNRFSTDEWSTGDRSVPAEQQARGQVPEPSIDAALKRSTYDYSVSVLPTFKSLWLPTKYPISSIDAPGDWRYDLQTMDFLSGKNGVDTAGIDYRFSHDDLRLSALAMARSGSSAGLVSNTFLELPTGFPPSARNAAVAVTKDVATRYEKAVALQEWFRKDGGFRYSLAQAPASGGMDDLVEFLDNKVGYCEQFASAMAAMARSLGIPARVAVGFLEPQRIAPGLWEYSTYDMHAWPEIFFPGSGWVRFEPTPADRASGVPGYTRTTIPGTSLPNVPSGPKSSDVARPGEDQTSAAAAKDEKKQKRTAAGSGFPWLPVLGVAGGLLVLAALALVPRALRRRRTQQRLTGEPEPAWAEIRDTMVDLHRPWPEGRSPRETGEAVGVHLGRPLDAATPERPEHGPTVDPEAAEALGRLVLALEQLRYARPGAVVPGVREDAETVIGALWGGATTRERRTATWWPASVLRRPSRRTTVEPPAPVSARFGGVVDHVG